MADPAEETQIPEHFSLDGHLFVPVQQCFCTVRPFLHEDRLHPAVGGTHRRAAPGRSFYAGENGTRSDGRSQPWNRTDNPDDLLPLPQVMSNGTTTFFPRSRMNLSLFLLYSQCFSTDSDSSSIHENLGFLKADELTTKAQRYKLPSMKVTKKIIAFPGLSSGDMNSLIDNRRTSMMSLVISIPYLADGGKECYINQG